MCNLKVINLNFNPTKVPEKENQFRPQAVTQSGIYRRSFLYTALHPANSVILKLNVPGFTGNMHSQVGLKEVAWDKIYALEKLYNVPPNRALSTSSRFNPSTGQLAHFNSWQLAHCLHVILRGSKLQAVLGKSCSHQPHSSSDVCMSCKSFGYNRF